MAYNRRVDSKLDYLNSNENNPLNNFTKAGSFRIKRTLAPRHVLSELRNQCNESSQTLAVPTIQHKLGDRDMKPPVITKTYLAAKKTLDVKTDPPRKKTDTGNSVLVKLEHNNTRESIKAGPAATSKVSISFKYFLQTVFAILVIRFHLSLSIPKHLYRRKKLHLEPSILEFLLRHLVLYQKQNVT